MKIDLPSGGWVSLDPDKVTNRVRQDANRAYFAVGAAGAVRDFASFDVLLTAMIDEWSLTLPLPKDTKGESLGEVSLDDANRMYKELLPLLKLLFPNFDVTPDRDSPTSPAST